MTDPNDLAALLAELERLLGLVGAKTWIADDFCEEEAEEIRLGTTDGSETYHRTTLTIALFWHSEHGDDRKTAPPLLVAEASAKLCALAKNSLPELLRLARIGLAAETPSCST